METDPSADGVIARPRIDRRFVDTNGNLTMSAYALLDGLFRRTGGSVAPPIDVDAIYALIEVALDTQPQSDPSTRETLSAVDELRNELASARGLMQDMRALIEDQAAELSALRTVGDLRNRVEQIEDRLQ